VAEGYRHGNSARRKNDRTVHGNPHFFNAVFTFPIAV
jgi:hypothetical protein